MIEAAHVEESQVRKISFGREQKEDLLKLCSYLHNFRPGSELYRPNNYDKDLVEYLTNRITNWKEVGSGNPRFDEAVRQTCIATLAEWGVELDN